MAPAATGQGSARRSEGPPGDGGMCRVRAPSIEAHGSFAFDPEPAIGQARRQLPSSRLRPRVENTTAQPCPCRGHASGHEATLRILEPARTRGTRDASFCWHGQLPARHQPRPSASLNPPIKLTILPWDPTYGIPLTLPKSHGEAGGVISSWPAQPIRWMTSRGNAPERRNSQDKEEME